ncbi:Uncharacterized protein APZ42_021995 [Daphnia magna]|uniref:Uncharacterized protein n=1 Tax=Daphnia magna TaxID=35525 RepID=A0A164W6A8_9CRUS|nr:Uncharacterized protein APZ42_021995 [Daphnia magna]
MKSRNKTTTKMTGTHTHTKKQKSSTNTSGMKEQANRCEKHLATSRGLNILPILLFFSLSSSILTPENGYSLFLLEHSPFSSCFLFHLTKAKK